MTTKIKNDFSEFESSAPVEPPKELQKRILGMVREKLDPSFLTLFTKLGIIQVFMGTLSLFVCPQYGMGLGDSDYLYLMFQNNFGPYGCMIACGVLFTSTAALASVLILDRPEIKKIVSFQWFIFPVLTIIFLTLFTCAVREFYLNVSLLWLTGALLGYLVTFDLAYLVKRYLSAANMRTI
jgi:hypothetical protein